MLYVKELINWRYSAGMTNEPRQILESFYRGLLLLPTSPRNASIVWMCT